LILIAEGTDCRRLSEPEARQLLLQWMKDIYHSPFDDLNQPIEYAVMLQHCRFICDFCDSLVKSRFEIQWKPGTPYINA
jgi:hypothetical protein